MPVAFSCLPAPWPCDEDSASIFDAGVLIAFKLTMLPSLSAPHPDKVDTKAQLLLCKRQKVQFIELQPHGGLSPPRPHERPADSLSGSLNPFSHRASNKPFILTCVSGIVDLTIQTKFWVGGGSIPFLLSDHPAPDMGVFMGNARHMSIKKGPFRESDIAGEISERRQLGCYSNC